MVSDAPATRQGLIDHYNQEIQDMYDKKPGEIRSAKGRLVETLAKGICSIAWEEAGGHPDDLSFQDRRRYGIPIQPEYIETVPPEVNRHILENEDEYFYDAQVDVHMYIRKEFVMSVECKSYSENAMLKRILVDFRLLKSLYPDIVCCLLQLENMLGGDYSQPLASPQLGSPRSHVLMSHFPEVSLNVMTLLERDRKIKEPIHDPAYFKELKPESLDHAINRFSQLLTPFV